MHVFRLNLGVLEVQVRPTQNWIFQKRNILQFIQSNASVFEALTRMGAPYGGSLTRA